MTRRFGRPPLDHDRQVLLLDMNQVEGLLSLVLNGRTIGRIAPATCSYEIELSDLAERNVLVVEIELPEAGLIPAEHQKEWGVIALVVRSNDSAIDARALASPRKST
jgi:hypothetical protein